MDSLVCLRNDYSRDNFDKVPKYLRNMEFTVKDNIWGISYKTDIVKEYNILCETLKKNSPVLHIMESPAIFIANFYSAIIQFEMIMKIRYLKAKIRSIGKMMRMYKRIRYKPGNTGYLEAKNDFYLLKC